MKLKKLVKYINDIADSDLSERKRQDHQIKKALRKLKKKATDLEKALQSETDPIEREELENKIRIVRAQRKKGIRLRKELKEAPQWKNRE